MKFSKMTLLRVEAFIISDCYSYEAGSIEARRMHCFAIAYNLVRTFEMEASSKTNPQQWICVVADKFRMSTNGGKEYTAQEVVDSKNI